VTPTGTHEGSVHLRLHLNNINRDSGIEIPEAWIPTIRKHNSWSVRLRTYEGTASQSWNNNEDRNAPIVANQGATNSDTQQLTSSPDEDQQYSSRNVAIYILKRLHRETNESSSITKGEGKPSKIKRKTIISDINQGGVENDGF